MGVSNDEPQANTPQSVRQPEVSEEMVEAACAAFERAQQYLVAPARSYPVREVMRKALEAALGCGEPGMPCPSCNMSNEDNPPRLPAGFQPDEDLYDE